MPLLITYKSKRQEFDKEEHIFSKNIGDELPSFENEEIISIQADGEEMKIIFSLMGGIPFAWHYEDNGNRKVMNKTQYWFGDNAKFVYYNLQW